MLIACSILLPLTNVIQIALGETITTTRILPSTINFTTAIVSVTQQNVTSTQPTSYIVTPYQYDNLSGRFLIWQTEDAAGSGGGDYSCLYFEYFLFNASARQMIHVNYELLMPGRSMYFYILNFDQFRQFSRSPCLYGWDGASELHVYAPSYDLNWLVPKTDEYAFVFFTTVFYGGYIQLTAQSYITTTSNSTVTYTTTTQHALQNSQTETYTSTSITLQPQQESQTNYYVPISIGLITALTISATLMKRKQKSHS